MLCTVYFEPGMGGGVQQLQEDLTAISPVRLLTPRQSKEVPAARRMQDLCLNTAPDSLFSLDRLQRVVGRAVRKLLSEII